MTGQVFLSYAMEDRDAARALVRTMEVRGWSISWERSPAPSAIESQALREALLASDAVVVLWSERSVTSARILVEAGLARERGTLVGAVLDDVSVPLPFVLDEPERVETIVARVADALATRKLEKARRNDSEPASLERAEEWAASRDWEDAIHECERWLREKPDDMKARRRLGEMQLEAGRTEEAAAQFARVAEHYADCGFLVLAIATYRKVLDLVPGDETYQKTLRALLKKREEERTGPVVTVANEESSVGGVEATTVDATVRGGVQFTLIAPPHVQPGFPCVLEVWAHGAGKQEEVLRRALGGDVVRSQTREAPDKTAWSCRLRLDGFDVPSPESAFRWQGGAGSGRFLVTAREAPQGARTGHLGIYLGRFQIARMEFVLLVSETTDEPNLVPARIQRHRSAFACYAAEDEAEVRRRLEAFERAMPTMDVFTGAPDLRRRKDALPHLLDLVAERDVFYLFWSRSAQASEDVEREWRYALKLRGPDFIEPVPLVSPEAVPPPRELGSVTSHSWSAAYRDPPTETRH